MMVGVVFIRHNGARCCVSLDIMGLGVVFL